FDKWPDEVVLPTRGADVNERDYRRVRELRERPGLSARESHIPHASPRQHLDRVPLAVGFRLRLVDLTHAPGADRVHQDVWAKDQSLSLSLQYSLGLKRAQDFLSDEELSQGRRLGSRGSRHEFADHLVELSAVDQSAAPQVPDEPFAGAEFGSHHGSTVLLRGRGRGPTRAKSFPAARVGQPGWPRRRGEKCGSPVTRRVGVKPLLRTYWRVSGRA